MFERRLYRAAFAPLLPAIIIAAFSLTNRPAALSSTLPASLFDGSQASAQLDYMVAHFPDRRPGSPGDDALASYVAQQFAQAASAASGRPPARNPSACRPARYGRRRSTGRAACRR